MTTLSEAAPSLLSSPKVSTMPYNPAGLCIIHRTKSAAADTPTPKAFNLLARSRTALSQLNESTGSRKLHPGDVLYWVGCVSAVGLLLLVAIR